MDCKLKREDLVSFFYGECATDDFTRIDKHVASCANCRKALEQLTSTSTLLQTWPDEDPRLDLTFVETQAPRRRWQLPAWGRWVAGLGTACAALVAILAFAEFEIRYRAGQLDLKWGPTLSAEAPQTAPLTQAELLSVQRQTLVLVDELLRASEIRQQRAFDQTLVHLARSLENQRHRDLQLADRRLEQFDRLTRSRFRRNENALIELMPVRYPDQ